MVILTTYYADCIEDLLGYLPFRNKSMQTEFLFSLIDEKSPRPSLFELYFLESILDLIKPAIRHLLFAVTTTITNASASISSTSSATSTALAVSLFTQSYFDDLFFWIQFAADSSALFRQRAGQFVERLYGLERVSTANSTTSTPSEGNPGISTLSVPQRLWSLVFFLIIPKLCQYLEELSHLLQQFDQENASESSTSPSTATHFLWRFARLLYERLCRLAKQALHGFVRLLPYLQGGAQVLVLGFRLMYVLGLSPYHHPIFALLQMKLMKSRHVDRILRPQEKLISQSSNVPLKLIFTSLFALRGVEWFVNQDFTEDHISTRLASTANIATFATGENTARRRLKTIPFPQRPKKASNNSVCDNSDKNKQNETNDQNNLLLCPLCRQERRHATAAPSGYVFCFRCISSYVQEKKCCPVTQLPCDMLDLIRLYENPSTDTDH